MLTLGTVRERVASAWAKLRESAWWGLVSKLGLGALALTALALIGSGALDGYMPTKSAVAPAEAAPAKRASRSIPSASASASPSASASVPPSSSASAPAMVDGKVVLNRATEEELTKLPGVGKKKAQAILALREKLGGRFKRVEDLMRVRGLKRKALERLRPHVVLDADPPPPQNGAK